MLPRIPKLQSSAQITQTGSTPHEESNDIQKQGQFASHTVEQIENPSAAVPESTLTIRPTVKPASNYIPEEDAKTVRHVDTKAVLEQQIAGILQECKIKGFELYLDDIVMSAPNVIPMRMDAHIRCATSYDNRENIPKALEMTHRALIPILKDFAKTYCTQYTHAIGLSEKAQEAFKKEVQAIVTQYMPKETPSLDTMLQFHDGKPIFSLGIEQGDNEGIDTIHVKIQELIRHHRVGGLVISMQSAIEIDDSFMHDKARDDAKYAKQAYDAHRKGLQPT